MLLKTSFDADSDEGNDWASSKVSVSNSANTASSNIIVFSGTMITRLISLIIWSTRTAMVSNSNSVASKVSEYSPFANLSISKLPVASVVVVISPGVKVTFTPSIAARVVRETTLPLTPPPCAKAVSEAKDNTIIRNVFILINIEDFYLPI